MTVFEMDCEEENNECVLFAGRWRNPAGRRKGREVSPDGIKKEVTDIFGSVLRIVPGFSREKKSSGLPALEQLFEIRLFQRYGTGSAVGTEIRRFRAQPLPHKIHGVVGRKVLACPYGRGTGVMNPYAFQIVHTAGESLPQKGGGFGAIHFRRNALYQASASPA